MSTIAKNRSVVCPGPSRRALLKAGLVGMFGLGFDEMLRLRAIAAQTSGKAAPKVKNCIMIWLAGGASHIDTFDPKPDATSDIRGEFQAIETSVPGLRISEVFPKLAKVMNKTTLLRALTSPEADHGPASQHLMTGYRPSPALMYPNLGSVVSKTRESSRGALPTHVAVPDAPLFSSSGYLTPAYDPFGVLNDPNSASFRVRDLTPPDRLTFERMKRRREMVHALDGFTKEIPDTPLTSSRDQFADQAYGLLTSTAAQAAFNVATESAEVRDRYGRTTIGQSCLLARRLVESGVSFVTVNDRGTAQLGWDTHQQNFKSIKETLAPPIDQGVSTLIADLDERGMLDSTLVFMMGEFGRTPKINPSAGRDHHGRANCTLMAGGGLPRGVVLGKTDSKGDSPIEHPVTPADIAAIVFTSLGIDPEHTFMAPDGRPIRLVENGQVPKGLMGVL